MEFLTPGALALAGGLTIPPLVALYFLKLKRRVYPISSTLLWRKAIEDLHVNAPFQRLRSSLLLLLQLLILVLGAMALGQPMLTQQKEREPTLILMIDQSASMSVVEADDRTRLQAAKAEAKRVIDAMDQDSRAMIIAFSDRATVVSSFDTDREALRRKIDTIEQTDSTSTLSEAVTLAEAYSQSLIIGGATTGADVAPESPAPAASVILLSDGGVEDARELSPQRLDISKMEVVRIGRRSDNVGIVSMDAQRNYERPEVLQVFANVRNFGDQPMTFDASLFINGEHVDVQTIELAPGVAGPAEGAPDQSAEASAPPGSAASIAFDEVEYAEGGVVEVRLNIRDALAADNTAWSVIQPPRRVDVLLVTTGNHLLEKVLSHLNIRAEVMAPKEYENAQEDELNEGGRSRYDLVIFDRHSTARLATGNYMFWGSAPLIDGVVEHGWTETDIIVDWNDHHPILRHTNIGSINVSAWRRIDLPTDAELLIEGSQEHFNNVLSYLTRGGSRFLICAFPLFIVDEQTGQPMLNTDWVLRWDFVTFMYDAVQYMSSSVDAGRLNSLLPGTPNTVPIRAGTREVTVQRPDGTRDHVPTAGSDRLTYARTRLVGTYRVEPAQTGSGTFAVNLFNANESRVAPRDTLVIGSLPVASTEGMNLVNTPLWPWLVLGLLAVLLFEWVVYNKRVFV
ncbi:MAG: BatA and WFA domain-containing protein [Phycisphaerae bacterium]